MGFSYLLNGFDNHRLTELVATLRDNHLSTARRRPVQHRRRAAPKRRFLGATGSEDDGANIVVGVTREEIAFLFTDIVGSSRLWEAHPEAMQSALAVHDELMRGAFEAQGGFVFSSMGDGMAVAFDSPAQALAAASVVQAGLRDHEWGEIGPLRVRMGIHVGQAQRRDGDYFGRTLNRCARLMAVGHGGQILVSGAARNGVDAEFRDLGFHRLRDLSEPEHIYQLVAAGLETDFPQLLSLDARPGNLPLQATTFIGREVDVVEAMADLSQHRIMTLTGVGGVGKTRLALQIAAESTPRFAHGGWLCELAPVGDPDAVTHAVAGALGVTSDGSGVREALLSRLEASHLLLVLDNCEHVLDAASRLAEEIVHRCPRVTVLATSREPLAVDGEKVRAVRSLDAAASAQLFADRAVAVRGVNAPDESEAAVQEICARLDGVPLAIELAAARAASMTPVEIAARLDERFRLLSGGRRTAVARQRTLRNTVDWSFDLLQAAEQRVFARLAVFAGGFTLDAAEAVADDPDIEVMDAVQSLVQKSMLVAELDSSRHRYRYSMLETLRQYAEERLSAIGEADFARRRHAEHFATWAERAESAEQTADEPVWAARIDAEIDNFRAAIAWTLGQREVAVAARVIVALDMHAWFHVWSEFDGWARSVTAALGSAEVVDELAARAEAAAAFFAWGAADNERAVALVESGLARKGRSHAATAQLYLARASVHLTAGDVRAAVEDDREAVRSAQASGNQWWAALDLAHLVMSTAASGDAATAARLGREALGAARGCGSSTAIAFSAFALADTIIDADPDKAVALLEEADAAAATAGLTFMTSLTRGSLITAQGRSNDPLRAVRGYLELLEQWRTAATVAHLRSTMRNAAEMLARTGRFETTALVYGAMQAWGSEPPPGSPEAGRLEVALIAARNELGVQFSDLVEQGKRLSDDEMVVAVHLALTTAMPPEEPHNGSTAAGSATR